ncbi:MAG TPA: hypothetical protein GX513_00625 [Firmicutes bacterium]|nr:hypothetical protein [Bacillota bacterium]
MDLDEGGGHSLGSLLPRACEGMAAVLLDGTVYLFGGWDGSRSLDQVLAFHPDTAIVETLPVRLPSGRHHVAAAAHDGRIWLFGGQAGTVPLDDVLLFTPGREGQPPSLQQVGRLPRPVSRAGAVSWGGELYVLGGFGSGGASPCIVRVEPAIPETSAEELPVRLPRGGGTAAAVLDGAIYLLQDGGSILRVVPRPRAALVFRAPAGEMGSAGEKVRWEVGAIEAEGQVHLLYSTSDDGSVWSPAVADPAELAPAHCFRVEVEFRPDPVRPARVRRIWGHVRPVEP